jgi:16S rRNA (guanine527-N7)-methyltransferase
MTPREALDRGLKELALTLPQEATERLLQYVGLLGKWNRTYNLTAIRDPLEMVSHHLLDSLAVLSHLPMPSHGTLADVGSGGGLPGIPLAVACPHWQVTLNDANQKKAAFLRQAAIELQLTNVQVHEGRVENWHATRFAVVISRAFADFAEFVSRCAHLARPDGVVAAMTGAAPNAPGCRTIALQVPLLDAQRHLVLCKAPN